MSKSDHLFVRVYFRCQYLFPWLIFTRFLLVSAVVTEYDF